MGTAVRFLLLQRTAHLAAHAVTGFTVAMDIRSTTSAAVTGRLVPLRWLARRLSSRVALSLLLVPVSFTSAVAQTGGAQAQPASQEDVARQLANPIANLVSIPLQLNWEQGVGPDDDLRFVLNFQPVVPFTLNERWNLIGRLILPFIGQPALVGGGQPSSGTGDIVLSAFLSPTESPRAVWGVGPVFGLPTTTDPALGSGRWSMGPTAVVLKQSGPLTYGALVNHLWSFAQTGNDDRADVNQTYIQPFLSYTTPTAVTYGISAESSANWEADTDHWTVPIFVQISKVTRLGPFPFSVGGAVGLFAAKPDGGPEWKFRMVGTLILPRSR